MQVKNINVCSSPVRKKRSPIKNSEIIELNTEGMKGGLLKLSNSNLAHYIYNKNLKVKLPFEVLHESRLIINRYKNDMEQLKQGYNRKYLNLLCNLLYSGMKKGYLKKRLALIKYKNKICDPNSKINIDQIMRGKRELVNKEEKKRDFFDFIHDNKIRRNAQIMIKNTNRKESSSVKSLGSKVSKSSEKYNKISPRDSKNPFPPVNKNLSFRNVESYTGTDDLNLCNKNRDSFDNHTEETCYDYEEKMLLNGIVPYKRSKKHIHLDKTAKVFKEIFDNLECEEFIQHHQGHKEKYIDTLKGRYKFFNVDPTNRTQKTEQIRQKMVKIFHPPEFPVKSKVIYPYKKEFIRREFNRGVLFKDSQYIPLMTENIKINRNKIHKKGEFKSLDIKRHFDILNTE